MHYKLNSARVWEIDFLRGIAIILMVIFHIVWDLNEFYGIPVSYDQGVVYYFGKAAVLLFIMITGISCTFSRNNLRRGLKIVGFALIVTIATYIYDPKTFIVFGILHLLGINILLYPVYRKFCNGILFGIGIIIILIGYWSSNVYLNNNYLLFLGFTKSNYYALDYYPMLPYSGLFLYGIIIARILYPTKRSLFRTSHDNNLISKLGKKSLIIYLIHQPIVLLVLHTLALINLI